MPENYLRGFRLMHSAIKRFNLDLSGLTVLTEAASGNYVYTPLIAALANAEKVYAITADSKYGKASEIIKETYELAGLLGVEKRLNITKTKNAETIKEADIITNLGFVRPLDRQMIGLMKQNTAIPLMWETWEFRDNEIDMGACKEKGIIVMGTDENHPKLDVFCYSGPLCAKMLFGQNIEIHKNKIAIVSKDIFGKVIEKYLAMLGAETHLIDDLKSEPNRACLKNSDALVIADYASKDLFIGKAGQISAKELNILSPGIVVVQFTGDVDTEELDRFNIPYTPKRRVGSFRMGKTFADLGPKPIIDLHCAGLKVGEAIARARREGKSIEESKTIALKYSPAQDFSPEQKKRFGII